MPSQRSDTTTVRKIGLSAALLVAAMLVAMTFLEAAGGIALRTKMGVALAPQRSLPRLRDIYNNWTRQIVQFEPACSQFDQELFYTLRPGDCRFRNIEFDTTIHVNSAGFRSDEESLNAPDIAVLGDSFAMGWGVNGPDTYAALLEQRTGLRVLDTGVSSYGTVREKLTLSRISLVNLKYLVIQYCSNDRDENLLFYLRHNTHRSLSKSDFDELIKWYRSNTAYYPGRNLDLLTSVRLFGRLLGRPRPVWDPPITEFTAADRQAEQDKPGRTDGELFVNALVNAGVPLPLSLKKIIVFANETYGAPIHQMIDDLQAMQTAGRLDALPGEIVILRTSDFLNGSHFYPLDGHLNRSGHIAMANAVASHLPAHEVR